ncbi:MAG: peptidase S8/S53 domain-containing protein [Monoraphidium minutum]|nr:MAG: peptidase S8/S53 domain-containing protein [Monoraphidium minutum]
MAATSDRPPLGRRAAAPAAAAGLLALLLLLPAAAAAAAAAAPASGDADYGYLDPPLPRLRPQEDAAAGTSSYIVLLNDDPPAVAAPAVAKALKSAFPRRRGGAGAAGDAGAAAAVEAYGARLRLRQDEVLASVASADDPSEDATAAKARGGGRASGRRRPRMTHQFTVAVNGFAAAGITSEQAAALRRRPDVLSITKDGRLYPHTYSTPAFLGLAGAGGLWEREFGGPEGAASDVLIGIIDTGIDSSLDSFAAHASASAAANASAASARRWPRIGPGTGACGGAGGGGCTPGKLLGCRFFESGADYDRAGTSEFTRAAEDISTCFGSNDHGTHVASTAAGAFGALKDGAGLHDTPSGMSGIAPGAALASYKVIWGYRFEDGERHDWAQEADTIAATEQAIKDGVDVINFSVGGPAPRYSFGRPTFEAFKGAAAAGVFVAASAGNSGPRPGSMGSNGMPWVATVASGTHPRKLYAEITLSAPAAAADAAAAAADGANATAAVFRAVPSRELSGAGPAPLYFAGDADAAGARCLPGSLAAAAAVNGSIVVCIKSDNATYFGRVDEVVARGAAGMILVNDLEGDNTTLRAGGMPLPYVHATAAVGRALIDAYTSSPGAPPMASLSTQKADAVPNEAPLVAPSSSRGPLKTDGGAVLKPDIMAPGVDIFAGSSAGRRARYMSGTSMASPHVAGLAALIASRRPSWSPAAIKSALMTTAGLTTNRGRPIPGTPFDFGAGQAAAAAALDPGLVYDAGRPDWERYACAAVDPKAYNMTVVDSMPEYAKPVVPAYCGSASVCGGGRCAWPQAMRDANLPSFALAGLSRGQSAKARRTATFVGPPPAPGAADANDTARAGGGAAFAPELQLPAGFKGKITVERGGPRGLTGAGKGDLVFASPSDARSFTLTVTASKDAPAGWSFGSLTWRGGGGRWAVRSNIALEVVAVA